MAPALRDHRSIAIQTQTHVLLIAIGERWAKGVFSMVHQGHLAAKKVQICLKVFGGPKQQSKYWQLHPFPFPYPSEIRYSMACGQKTHQCDTNLAIICMLLHSSQQKGQCGTGLVYNAHVCFTPKHLSNSSFVYIFKKIIKIKIVLFH